MNLDRCYFGDCLEVMKTLPDGCVDAVVTDPPYHLTQVSRGGHARTNNPDSPHGRHRIGDKGFMGKQWDGGDIAHRVELWAECLRLLKPGGHLLAFAGTRTYHRMACAIEDAGFEIRDMVAWVYGSGFPKSKNLNGDWNGWGTALKPSQEPIALARKPFSGTVTSNVLQFGTGALNIDGCRVHGDDALGGAYTVKRFKPGATLEKSGSNWRPEDDDAELYHGEMKAGRWPANLIHDGSDEVVALFPDTKSGLMSAGTVRAAQDGPCSVCYGTYGGNATESDTYGDSGSAARFFYCPKASRADRNDGLHSGTEPAVANSATMRERETADWQARNGNHHPTVKPTELMRYLCRLVTPPQGVVLDPFMGSGSTGRGAVLEGFRFVGIEREVEYFEIAKARIAAAQHQYNEDTRQMGLELVA